MAQKNLSRFALCALASVAAFALAADTAEATTLTRIDVTAAVRAAGDGLATATANVATYSGYEVANVFDGVAVTTSGNNVADNEVRAGMFSTFVVATNAYAKGGLEIVYEISDSYETGKDVVIDGYSILTGSNVASAFNRLPGTWQFQGYDAAAGAWVTLDEHTAYAGWKTKTDGLAYDGTTCVGNVFHFLNSRAFRKFRLLVTAPYWRTAGVWTDEEAAKNNGGAFALTEMQLFGYVAEGIDGTVYPGSDEVVDLTAAVRGIDDGWRTVKTNCKEYYAVANAFDGVVNSDNRFFSYATDVATGVAADGGAWIEYDFSDEFASGADVVVSGYSLTIASSFGDSLRRQPSDWQFQAYDATKGAWVTLDEYSDFRFWETTTENDTAVLTARFDFANPSAYRRYRLFITRQYFNWAGCPSKKDALDAVQFSEIRLFGHLGKGIAGTVATEQPKRPLAFADWRFKTVTQPGLVVTNWLNAVITNSSSTYAQSLVDTQRLFNTNRYDRAFFYLDNDGATGESPFDVCFELPDDVFLASKDVVLTNYVMELSSVWADREKSVPQAWRLEAFADGRWIALDRRSASSVTWTKEPFWWPKDNKTGAELTEYDLYTARCEIAEAKRFSATKYRLRVTQPGVNGAGRTCFHLGELTLNGFWGVDVANPPPKPKGLAVIVR